MIETHRHPDLRVRIKHTQTNKGWRLDETTVEMSTDIGGEGALRFLQGTLRSQLAAAHEIGLTECNRRNLLEGHDL